MIVIHMGLLMLWILSVPVVIPEMYPLLMDARVIVYHGKQYLAIYKAIYHAHYSVWNVM